MKNIKKNKYNKDYVQISLNIPIDLLNTYDVIAEYLNVKRSEIIIASMSYFAEDYNFNEEYRHYDRNAIKRRYREEHQR